jgi:hypothetical protein
VTDPVLVVLGGAVVKTAVRLWVGPNVLADNLTADLTDLLEGRVSDAGERRKLRRRFDEMEDIIADQVLAALGTEFRELDEGERNAAVAAVTETFNRARVTGEELFSRDLDPLNLEKNVRAFTGDATRDLSWGGTQLYDRILARCCAYILEIADKLPRFQTGAFAELLKRDSQILARLEDVLARLPAPADSGEDTDRVETAYRQRVVKIFDRLELFGLDFASQWYSLSIAYVNLTAAAGRVSSGGQRLSDLAARSSLHPSRAARPSSSAYRSSIEAVGVRDDSVERWLAKCPRLVISGRAGGGKTTILQWIAVRGARRDFDGAASRFNGYVPFFVRLRDYVDSALPQPEEFLDKAAPLLAPEARSWPRAQLRSGHALVLIDGADEMPEAQRPKLLTWLAELTELFPDARYVITMRPGAIQDAALKAISFAKSDLEPMDPGLIRVFIERWHTAMREWQKDIDSLARLDRCRDRLINTLDNDRFLSDLANTPLLAGLICALNHHLDAELPRRRGEIFEKALAMFHERDRKRGIRGDFELNLMETYHLLGDLALWMLRNNTVEAATQSVQATLIRSSASLPGSPHDGAKLCRYLLLRSGLLREPTTGSVDFVHRTFQEFLAAWALIDSDNVGEIVKNAGDDQWREVVILASGLGNLRQTTDLLRGLLRNDWRDQGRFQRQMLAAASLNEIRSADPDVLKQIDITIPRLLPPKDMNQAEALSHVGERLIPHLTRTSKNPSTRQSLPIIRTASLIGGAGGLDLIAHVTRHSITLEQGKLRNAMSPNSTVTPPVPNGELWNECMRAWQYFDPEMYAMKVIVPLGIKHVLVTEVNTLRALTKIPRLTGIEFRHCSGLTDLFSLRGRSELEMLSISDCTDLRDYTAIIGLWNLRTCSFSGQEGLNLAILANLHALTSLQISNMNSVDIRPLARRHIRISLRNVNSVIHDPNQDYNEIRRTTPTLWLMGFDRRGSAMLIILDFDAIHASAQPSATINLSSRIIGRTSISKQAFYCCAELSIIRPRRAIEQTRWTRVQ